MASTTSTLSTSFETTTVTATVASVTIFSTSFVPTLLRRDYPQSTAAPFYDENPYAYSVFANDVNASIAATYYSACSCLSLKPSTVESIALTSTIRTISGEDSEQTTETVYVTSGTSTQVLTRAGGLGPVTVSSTITVIPTPLSSVNTSGAVPLSTSLSSVGTLSLSAPTPVISSNSSLSLSSAFGSSGTRPAIAPTLNLTSFSIPSLTPTLSFNATTSLPPVTGPSSGFPTFPAGNLSSSSRPSSGFPTATANTSISSLSISASPVPSTNLSISSLAVSASPIPSANITISSQPASGPPVLPTNLTSYVYPSLTQPPSTSATAAIPGYPLNTTIFPPPVTNTVTVTAISLSGTLSPPTSTSATAAAAATASDYPTLDISNCPGLNGTVVGLSDGQQFAIVCQTEYGGPVDVGLQEPTLQDCIQQCGTANNGFSAVRCRGLTYYPNVTNRPNCNFKNAASLLSFDEDEYAVSAVLINAPALNATIAAPTSFPTQTQ
ncbi:MAG: hypothetical protein Q9170_004493 [Blastenia crenularia]